MNESVDKKLKERLDHSRRIRALEKLMDIVKQESKFTRQWAVKDQENLDMSQRLDNLERVMEMVEEEMATLKQELGVEESESGED